MDDYLTEEERLEALKRWWKENSRSVLTGVAVGALLIAGWNFWQARQQRQAEQASTVFEQLLKADAEKHPEAALKLSERLIDQFPNSGYGVYGRLFAAKFKAEQGDLAAAKTLLLTLVASSHDDNVRHLARLRAAQVMLAMNENETALKLLEAPDAKVGEPYQALYAELKGDLLLALKRDDEARTAYEQARQSGKASPLLEFKLQDLGAPRS